MWKVYKVTTPSGQTYIGVTKRDPHVRLVELRCHRGIDGTVEVLAEFEAREDALAVEEALVPDFHTGLNRARGGRNSRVPLRGAENGSSLRVSVEGVEYETLSAAAKVHGLKQTAAHYRLASPYFPDWVYLDPPRASYWQDKQAAQRRLPAISVSLRRRT